jgi:Carbohydrate esterase, sialic acid-specific acetylesterase/Secretion system C-terminal sorting domain
MISGIIELTGWSYMSAWVTRNNQKYNYRRSNFQYGSNGIGTFSFSSTIKAELADYNFDVYACRGTDSVLIVSRKNVAVGEVFLINGQSNGAAYAVDYLPYNFTNKYCRTFGLPEFGKPFTEADTLWSQSDYTVGVWGLELQRLLLEKYQMPTCVINGSVHGTQIDSHQRDNGNPTGLGSIYGRLLYRAKKARVDNNFRALFFWQGESDIIDSDPWQYPGKFERLYSSWQTDFPNLQKYYIFQIGILNVKNYGSGVLRDYQRQVQDIHKPKFESIATVGNTGFDGGHYTNEGYITFANEIFRRIERDYFGVKTATNVSSPNIRRAFYTSEAKNEIALVFENDQEMIWKNDTTLLNRDGSLVKQFMKDYFLLDNTLGNVTSGRASKNTIILTLKNPSSAKKISYLLPYYPYFDTENRKFYGGPFLQNKLGVMALSFQDVSILDKEPDAAQKLASTPIAAKVNFYDSITLSWQLVTGATQFILERKDSTNAYKVIKTLDGTTTSFTDINLKPNTLYTYRIQAINNVVTSDYTVAEAKTNALLDKPIFEVEIISKTSLKLKWNSVRNVTSYTLERKTPTDKDFVSFKTLSASTVTLIDSNLNSNTLYVYRIKALGDKTESPFTQVEATTPALLKTPELTSTIIYFNALKISWKTIAGATSFKLERKSGTEDYKQIALLDGKLTEFQDKDLKPNTAYNYRLKAFGDKTESLETSINTTTPALLANPELMAESITHENIKLKWKTIVGSNKYVLERQAQGETIFKKIFETDAILEYNDSPLKANQSYTYRMKAFSMVSESPYANLEVKTAVILNNELDISQFFQIYPNPTKEKVLISFPIITSGNISLVDVTGNRLFETSIQKQKDVTYDVSSMKKGFYLVIVNINGELYTQKLIIE